MLKKIIVFAAMIVLLSCAVVCSAFDVSARSAILICADTGEVIYEKNADERLPMASTTKIMTALVAIENGSLDKIAEVDDSAVGIEGSSMYLYHGERITLRRLLYGLMLSSGNDAAKAVAIHIAGSEDKFAYMMNERAEVMGLNDTAFKNPSGLDADGHYTTARELALMSREAMKNDVFREIVGSLSHEAGNLSAGEVRWVHNHNKMLSRYDGADGIKTGFTKKAGRCLVSSASRDGVSLICVTLNCPDDWNEHERMLDMGFESLKNHIVLNANESWQLPVGGSTKNNVTVKLNGNIEISALDASKLSYRVYLPHALMAPRKSGECAGEIAVFYDGEYVCSHDIYLSEDIPARERKGSFFERLMEYIN